MKNNNEMIERSDSDIIHDFFTSDIYDDDQSMIVKKKELKAYFSELLNGMLRTKIKNSKNKDNQKQWMKIYLKTKTRNIVVNWY